MGTCIRPGQDISGSEAGAKLEARNHKSDTDVKPRWMSGNKVQKQGAQGTLSRVVRTAPCSCCWFKKGQLVNQPLLDSAIQTSGVEPHSGLHGFQVSHGQQAARWSIGVWLLLWAWVRDPGVMTLLAAIARGVSLLVPGCH